MGRCSSGSEDARRCHGDEMGGRLKMTETVMRVKREQSSLLPPGTRRSAVCVCAAGCSTDALISQTGRPLREPHQPAHFSAINPTCTVRLPELNQEGKNVF